MKSEAPCRNQNAKANDAAAMAASERVRATLISGINHSGARAEARTTLLWTHRLFTGSTRNDALADSTDLRYLPRSLIFKYQIRYLLQHGVASARYSCGFLFNLQFANIRFGGNAP